MRGSSRRVLKALGDQHGDTSHRGVGLDAHADRLEQGGRVHVADGARLLEGGGEGLEVVELPPRDPGQLDGVPAVLETHLDEPQAARHGDREVAVRPARERPQGGRARLLVQPEEHDGERTPLELLDDSIEVLTHRARALGPLDLAAHAGPLAAEAADLGGEICGHRATPRDGRPVRRAVKAGQSSFLAARYGR